MGDQTEGETRTDREIKARSLACPILAAAWTSFSTLSRTAQLCFKKTQSARPQQHWMEAGSEPTAEEIIAMASATAAADDWS